MLQFLIQIPFILLSDDVVHGSGSTDSGITTQVFPLCLVSIRCAWVGVCAHLLVLMVTLQNYKNLPQLNFKLQGGYDFKF